jgi:type VI secretion system protein ImpK
MTISAIPTAGASPNHPAQITLRLSSLFTDLISYVLYFQTNAANSNLPLVEVRGKITAFIDEQEKRARAEGYNFDRYLEARYAVLSWVDEVILTSKWTHRTQWQYLMSKYYDVANAGEGFFQKLANLPSEAADVKEVFYLCLSLGFQGKYAFGDGPKQLAELRNTLYRQLPAASKGLPPLDQHLFPEAYQEAKVPEQEKPRPIGFRWYGWVLLLPALFAIYWMVLGRQVDEKIAWLDANPLTEVRPEPQRITWQLSLINEVVRLGFDARPKDDGVRVILPGLFGASDTKLSEKDKSRIVAIASAINREASNRKVRVDGHSSSEGSKAENDQYSRERARSVADYLESQGIKDVKSDGHGSQVPFENQEQSRRVEIFIGEGA